MKLYIHSTRKLPIGKYCTEDGQIMYKVVRPFILDQTTIIYRNITSLGANNNDQRPDLEEGGEKYMKIGEIKFHRLRPTVFRTGGKSYDEHDLFKGGRNILTYANACVFNNHISHMSAQLIRRLLDRGNLQDLMGAAMFGTSVMSLR